MLTLSTSSAETLQLHLVPAGRRLDFASIPGQFADVYRRSRNQSWQCVAQNACSPFLDRVPLTPGDTPEYRVHYRDSKGFVTATTPSVQAHPLSLPAVTSWLNLP
jgi:hypothetical protein